MDTLTGKNKTMATTHSLTLIKPDDWHLHLREGNMLAAVLPYTATVFGRALVMPNLIPPVTTVERALTYYQQIKSQIQSYQKLDHLGIEYHQNNETELLAALNSFSPIMSLYLTSEMTTTEISKIKNHPQQILGCKLYPQGATTNSSQGVKNIADIYPLLERMQKEDIPLMIHGEDIDLEVDIFDRERIFIEKTLSQLTKNFPELRITLEHITSKDAVDFVRESSSYLKASITPHHLLLNRNHLLVGGIKPHYYCLPIAKLEKDRLSLVEAATSGEKSFFLGTDSAPHTISSKESSCGCAGIFCAPATLSICADIFAKENKLKHLEGFCSLHGAKHYRHPLNQEKITLYKETHPLAKTISIQTPTNPQSKQNIANEIHLFLGGETLNWKIKI